MSRGFLGVSVELLYQFCNATTSEKSWKVTFFTPIASQVATMDLTVFFSAPAPSVTKEQEQDVHHWVQQPTAKPAKLAEKATLTGFEPVLPP